MTPQDQMSAFCSREGQHDHYLMADICACQDVNLLHRSCTDVSLLQLRKATRGGQAARVRCTWLRAQNHLPALAASHGSMVHREQVQVSGAQDDAACTKVPLFQHGQAAERLAHCGHGPKGFVSLIFEVSQQIMHVQLGSVKLVATVQSLCVLASSHQCDLQACGRSSCHWLWQPGPGLSPWHHSGWSHR